MPANILWKALHYLDELTHQASRHATMSNAYQTILYALRDGVARITFNRPDKRNAMNPRLHDEMHALMEEVNADPAVRVVVLTGAGPAFCAGADIKEYFKELEDKPAERDRVMRTAERWIWTLFARSPKPTITMINGYCFGGGLLVVLASDVAIAGSNAVFGLPEINWGHVPGGAASKRTLEAMGVRQATYYALTGETFGPDLAERYGLITRSVPQEGLAAEVDRVAAKMTEKSPQALQTTKEIYRNAAAMDDMQIHEYVNAKIDQLRVRDTGGMRAKGMVDFVDKKSFKPGRGVVRPSGE